MLMRFIESGRDLKVALAAFHDPVLVGCSIVAAVLAAYAALGIAEQIRAARGPVARLLWLASGAVAMGLGIWTMHFTAMLSYRLPVAVRYDLLLTALSVLPAIAAATVALYLISRRTVRSGSIAFGGLLIGAGIGAMHYAGMAAMRLDAEMLYSSLRVALSVLVAVGLGMLSLYTHYTLSKDAGSDARLRWARPASALIMGAAVSGMHYTAMAAVYFFPAPESAIAATGVMFDAGELAISVVLSSGILSLLLIVTTHEAELAASTNAARAARKQNILLEAAVRERTCELEETNALARQNLERKVAERTEELAKALEAATEADRMKSDFMANVTHELRTPLNSVIGFAEMLKDEVPGALNAKQAAFAADILASGERLLALVEGILEMSRLDAAGAALEREPVEIGAALDERVTAHRKAAEARCVTICLDVAPDAGRAELDPKALCRMLDVLLDNAIKFNREGGTVAVSARRAGGARAARSILQSPTRASASRMRTWRNSSSRSPRSMPASRAGTAAWGWGWRSRGGWLRCTAARSRSQANPG